MQKLIYITLTAILGSGLIIAFVMYKQLGTETSTLGGSPALVTAADGSECGQIGFSIGARTLGQWYFEVPKAKTITGTVTVEGGETNDVGFSIWSPTNRVVRFDSERMNQTEFLVEQTIRGEYRFDFDNRHSTFSDKNVTVALCVV